MLLSLYLNARRIVIGRDMRLSALALAKAFIKGAISSGAWVTDIGTTTSPMLYYAIIGGKFDGGVMVTASHLPGGINGFRLCREKAIPLSGDHGLPALERWSLKSHLHRGFAPHDRKREVSEAVSVW